MQAFILISMALELLLFLGVMLLGGPYVRRTLLPAREGTPEEGGNETHLPRAAVIVPLTGNSPEMGGCLQTLLHQHYPDYEVILVTRDQEDPATALVRELLPGQPKVRHVLSGPARRCGQKNHNLLAGVAAADPEAQILVFCDSTHLASPTFLRELIGPIDREEARLTTCFRRVLAADSRLATLGMAWSVLAIQLMHGIKGLVQPWGGALALPRPLFASLGVESLWGKNVVDDVSLVPALRRAGLRVRSVPGATLTTALAGQTWGGWIDWLTRQMLFVKFCLPGTWLLAAAAVYLIIGPVLLAAAGVLASAVGWASWHLGLAGLGFLTLLTGMGLWGRTLAPKPTPRGPWIAAFYALLWVASWCYLKTWGTSVISWRGISYRVTWGGRVTEIEGQGPGARGQGPGVRG